MQGLDFGEAIRLLKAGDRVMRDGWNGKGMFLFLVTPGQNGVGGIDLHAEDVDTWNLPQRPVICMKDAQNCVAIGWLASQTDMLAEDWRIVP